MSKFAVDSRRNNDAVVQLGKHPDGVNEGQIVNGPGIGNDEDHFSPRFSRNLASEARSTSKSASV